MALTKQQQVRRVLLITLVLNMAVALGKIIIGAITGALAITADGIHSLMDGSGNVAGLLAIRIAERPADADHPYGHRRYETLAALFIGGLLLLTAWEMIQGIFERLSGGDTPVLTPLAFVVMAGTLIVNIFVSRYQIRAGHRLNSQILLADAANTRADVFVTLSVIASMVFVALLGWAWADIAAALLVTLLIGRAAWQIVSRAGLELVDTAPYPPDVLAASVADIPAVKEITRIRSRGRLDAVMIDVDVAVAPEMTAAQTAAVASAIRDRLHDEVDHIEEIEVHFTPDTNGSTDFQQVARTQADVLGLATHEVIIRPGTEGDLLEMHVEVPPDQTLAAAHEQVSQLEAEVQRQLPHIAGVITHIEPSLTPAADGNELAAGCPNVATQVSALLRGRYPGLNWHDIHIHSDTQGFAATMHVTLPPQITVEAAHRLAEEAEMLLRLNVPGLERVTIHTEPPDSDAA